MIVSAVAGHLRQNLEQALLKRLLVVLLCGPDADIWHLACLDQRLSPAPPQQRLSLGSINSVNVFVDMMGPS